MYEENMASKISSWPAIWPGVTRRAEDCMSRKRRVRSFAGCNPRPSHIEYLLLPEYCAFFRVPVQKDQNKIKTQTPICIYILMSCLCTIYTWGEFSEGCFRIESDYCISDVFEGGMRKIELYWRSIFEDGLLAHVRTTSGFTICTTTLSQYAYYALDIVLPRGKRHTNHPSMASNFCGPVILLIPSVKTPAEICPSPVLLKLQIDQNYIFLCFFLINFSPYWCSAAFA